MFKNRLLEFARNAKLIFGDDTDVYGIYLYEEEYVIVEFTESGAVVRYEFTIKQFDEIVGIGSET